MQGRPSPSPLAASHPSRLCAGTSRLPALAQPPRSLSHAPSRHLAAGGLILPFVVEAAEAAPSRTPRVAFFRRGELAGRKKVEGLSGAPANEGSNRFGT